MNDVKLVALVKVALEYNASVISQASLLFNQEWDEHEHRRAYDWFSEAADSYTKQCKEILERVDDASL